MARLARVVVPGAPHHVTQRGNRRQQTFFGDADYALYRDLVADSCAAAKVECWAYCLMPNHVHLTLVPSTPDGLHRALGQAHRRYTREVNRRHGWTGYLWQGRFASAPMDEPHLIAAARYIALNPVRAGMVETAGAWPWSSAPAHLAGRDDALVTVGPLLSRIADFAAFLSIDADPEAERRLRKTETTGRPLGAEGWVKRLEADSGRALAPRKRGRKARATHEQAGPNLI